MRGRATSDIASLSLQGEPVVCVKEQLGHSSIQITADTCGHLIPGANRGAMDRLDDADSTIHNPESHDEQETLDEMAKLSSKEW